MISNEKIQKTFSKLQDLNVCVIGETIIDEYIYVDALGTASKDPVLSTRKIHKEKFAGGILAVANHLSQFVKNVNMISLLGEKCTQEEFINNHLSSNIKSTFFYKKNAETIVKTRFLDKKRLIKLFKFENSDGKLISQSLENNIKAHLKDNISKYDIIMLADFGHGFLTRNLRNFITDNASYLALNVQTNSSNFGFNPLSKYESADFVTMNHRELKMYFQDDEYRRDHLLEELIKTGKYNKILLTASKEGVIYSDGINKYSYNAFNTHPIDTVGAGDAVFSISTLFGYIEEDEIIPKLANIVGAIAVQTIGNKEPITKKKIVDFIEKEGKRYAMESV